MKPYLKFGLLVGGVSTLIIIPVSILLGICGPFISLLGGSAAGFLTAFFGKESDKRTGAQHGGIAGAITGGFTLVGQLMGGLLILTFIQVTNTPLLIGTVPNESAPVAEKILYYASGMGVGLCFGLIGIVLAVAAGALAGYLTTKDPGGKEV